MIEAIGTYLPPWGAAARREAGPDEDTVTMAVAAGLQALSSVAEGSVQTVVLVTRDLPLLEGGNSAPLLAGLGLADSVDVREQIGGAPAALSALLSAEPGTLVIAADVAPTAGAAAAFLGTSGLALTGAGRINRSMPVATRNDRGATSDYADPRLLRVQGLGKSLEQLGLDGKASAVAGLAGKDAAALTLGDPPLLPTTGASSALFALAALVERRDGGRLLAVEQATVAAADLAGGTIPVSRNELVPQPVSKVKPTPGPDINISLAAYDRAFDAKLRLEAAKCTTCGTLSYPHRYRCLVCGSEEPTDTVELPRDAEIYTQATIYVPVPGLAVPYTVTLVELGDTGVRTLVRLTGAAAGSTSIGDRGTLVFRRVAVRSGVPDYGYAFLPSVRVEVAA
ncbi:MAG: hypothetical protein JWL70_2690 [Acidimicrobiia bacterium]|nr:hypothetical protein [Acidimicrobiia bacterium]